MISENEISFIYKTVKNYKIFEDFIKDKLRFKNKDKGFYEGYLIDKKYFDYWKKFTDYNIIKNDIVYKDYRKAKSTIKNYRFKNKYKNYQEDACQYTFLTPVSLFKDLKDEGKQYVLIDQNFWKLICRDEGIDDEGGMKYRIDKEKIIFDFGKYGKLYIQTDDNIIRGDKEIYVQSITKDDIGEQYDEDGEDFELKKLFLLYAFEQEIRSKVNNLQHKEKRFKKYYLISEEWISEYKKYYHYDELCQMIDNRNDLKDVLNKGYTYAKENIDYAFSQISMTRKKSKKAFPAKLKSENTFLSEGAKININNNNSFISYWKKFELVNKDLAELFSNSEYHEYTMEIASTAKGLINGGKIILDLSNDQNNEDNYAFEIGVINNNDMIFLDEYIFQYDDEEAKNEHFNFFIDKFYLFQKDDLNFDINLECDLINDDGQICGTAFKIPPHD